jgi:hypothetical protein
MLNVKDFSKLDDAAIRRLRGGRKRGLSYFIGIRDSENSDVLRSVHYGKLRNQLGTKRQSSFPAGYEPYLTPYGERIFCLSRNAFPVPSLWMPPGSTLPAVHFRNRPAVILETPDFGSDARHALDRAAERFKLEYKIVKAAVLNQFREIFDLLGPCCRPWMRSPVIVGDEACKQFERRLAYAEIEMLRDLVSLLAKPAPEVLVLPIAA